MPPYEIYCLVAPDLGRSMDCSEIPVNHDQWEHYVADSSRLLHHRRAESFTALFLEEPSDWVWSTIARPSPRGFRLPFELASSAQLSPLEALPNEILDMIYIRLSLQKLDAVSLGLCSKFLWNLLARRIHSHFHTLAAPFAQTAVAILGDGVGKILPPAWEAMFPDFVPLAPRRINKFPRPRHGFWPRLAPPPCLTELPEPGIDTSPFIHIEERGWKKAISLHLPLSTPQRIPDYGDLGSVGHISLFHLFPQDQEWILRNHTTKETISSSHLTYHNLRYASLHPYLTFHHVLIPRLCWSSLPRSFDARHDYRSNISRGCWAGHAFDIVTRIVHETQQGVEQWVDVSQDAVQSALNLWRLATEDRFLARRHGRLCRPIACKAADAKEN
ncbi:hypothetical protein BCR34DRAFT_53440 [Clohesyomyces aquaticus]|uniref:F-box domain-containing protein n=1 Tax=Clohesyomyces aquaticus TaxID=1231657 RepID=A0A1Y1Z3X0_9PLEO|nr:hypothetical protein BCR34DRAFT_53440 [Clohesyomyces aquaticus]